MMDQKGTLFNVKVKLQSLLNCYRDACENDGAQVEFFGISNSASLEPASSYKLALALAYMSYTHSMLKIRPLRTLQD